MEQSKNLLEPTNRNHRIIYLILIILLTAGLVGGSVWYVMDKKSDQQEEEIKKLEEKKKAEEKEKKDREAKRAAESASKKEEVKEVKKTTGTIKGQGTYPSERLPSDFKVNAINILTNEVYSAAITSGVDYALEVPAGKYYVYATTESFAGKAYYNKFITCGMKVECTDTSKIAVVVAAGETVSDITVGDFWNN